MAPSTAPLARRERLALCDLALVLGPDAPTLCTGWVAKDLVTHLLVREHRPLAAAGLVVPGLSALTDRAMARYRRRDFGVLVERLRRPGLTPYAVPVVERALNTLEFFVHHEDLRRAQPGWEPRALAGDDVGLLWRTVAGAGRMTVRRSPVPVVLRRADTGATATAKAGDDPVVVTGPVPELALFVFGRSETRDLELEGSPDRVAALRAAPLGA